MTNSNSGDRLDRLEGLVETMGQRVDEITIAVQMNQQQIGTAFEAIDRLANVQLQLGQIMDNERQRTNTVLERQDRILDSINAELERQGRILDYLLRRDQNGSGNEPP